MKKALVILLLYAFNQASFAQSVTIDPRNTATNIIDAKSTNQGITVPKMTTIEKGTIANKVEGMMVYDTDAKQFSYWTGTTWVNFGNSVGVGWSQTGDDISNTNNGNVGIGTGTPKSKLEINSGTDNQSGLRLTQLLGSQSIEDISTDFALVTSAIGLAFDNAENLYCTGFNNNTITKITPDGTATIIASGNLLFNNLDDIVLGPDGNMYITNYTGNTVIKMTLSPSITFQTFASGFSNPIGLTFDSAGNLYVTNAGNGTLSKVSSTGTVISHSFATGFSSPYNCVYSSITNKIYVSNYGANEIAEISLAGGAKTTFKSGVNFCTGITIDNTGNLFVSQAGANKISRITTTGIMTDYTKTSYPFDLAFDKTGNLFVANQTSNKVSRSGTTVSTLLAINENGDVAKTNKNIAAIRNVTLSVSPSDKVEVLPNDYTLVLNTPGPSWTHSNVLMPLASSNKGRILNFVFNNPPVRDNNFELYIGFDALAGNQYITELLFKDDYQGNINTVRTRTAISFQSDGMQWIKIMDNLSGYTRAGF